jgi:CYTH domain-containing protein
MEIERKYLLREMPDNLEGYRHIEIEQGYISVLPVVRIRKKVSSETESYVLTIKSSGMLSRQEYEMDITAEEYRVLSEKVDGNIITKTRYIIPLREVMPSSDSDSLVLELDVFEGAFSGLVMGEIEFPDEKTADSFEPAGIFKSEVTFDKRFHNSNMSTMSAADIQDFIKSLDHA